MKKSLFIIGLTTYLFAAILIGAFNVAWLYLFGLPLLPLIVGLAMVWVSKAPVWWRIGGTLLAVPLMVGSFLLAIELGKAEPETFLIPEGFRGEFVVFYDEQCGADPRYENDRRIYEIASNGVLVTKFPDNNGSLDQKFYFVDQDGSRVEFPRFHRQNYETEKKEWSMYRDSPVEELTRETVGAFWSYGSELGFVSRNLFGFIVSDYHYFERDQKERFRERKEFEKRAAAILNTCREKSLP